jgi:hypothetical protein
MLRTERKPEEAGRELETLFYMRRHPLTGWGASL